MKPAEVVVLGVTGMLGHKVFQRLRRGVPATIGLARGEKATEPLATLPLLAGDDVIWGADAEDLVSLGSLLESLRPQVLVNCVGIVKQRSEATAAVPSIAVNALLPHWLAERLQRWGGRLIHFSTDCVFNGQRGMYREDDVADAEDLYGKTKALGEVTTINAITLRTSIIGRELRGRRSLIEWFLAQRGGRVRGFQRVIYSGLTTNQMAKLVERLIREHPGLAGLHHVAADPISKYDLLGLVNEAFGAMIQIDEDECVVLDRSLNSESFKVLTGWAAPGWGEMITEMASDPTPYVDWQERAASQAGRRSA